MAEPLPPSLTIPEVSRFVKRANQLRTVKPALAYWCEYHAVNQIVAKGLHNGDDAAFNFTKTLIDRLEATKNERATDDAIVDNTAGQAYVEQFANETFDRAERALRANKVTRQTADTFDAAATFLDLGSEWGALDAETLQKIKFAKWNAARILKAIKEGKDPNESNPKIAEAEQDTDQTVSRESGALDPNDPEVKELEALAARAATVEDIPDAGEQRGDNAPLQEQFQPSPQAPAENDYFPPAPSNVPETFAPSPLSQSPTQPVSGMPPPPDPISSISTTAPHVPAQPSPQIPARSIQTHTPQVSSPNTDPSAPPSWTTTPKIPTHHQVQQPPYVPQPSAPAWSAPVVQPAPPPVQQQPPPAISYSVSSHKDLDKAQKHAKWAISALNFDDIPTAVQELRNALACLGAQ
ncbi:hypothetical protein NLU13_1283 [Sarocladium strictum]|uniref:Uncharacterized protein n=1 Tax=Sarocladium strictum TaxID=5046 RepID=A0AA39GRF0_SARSR|nr:hypothetical protein NLU13_1283 [Sarocladium strictum]